MAHDGELMARSRARIIPSAEAVQTICLAGLEDPFDPRAAARYAVESFLEWTSGAPETDEDEETPRVPIQEGPIEVEWHDEHLGEYRTAMVNHLGHRVLLVIESRLEGAAAPLRYGISTQLAHRADAICCVYLQRDLNGDIGTVLDGWVDPANLPESGETVWLAELEFRPMHKLWERIRVKAAGTLRLAGDAPATARRVVTTAAASPTARAGRWTMAAAVLIAASILTSAYFLRSGSRLVATAIEMDPHAGSTRGGGNLISGMKFDVEVRAVTPMSHGWLYQVGRDSARMLKPLERDGPGVLAAKYEGTVWRDNLGVNLLVTVVCEKAPAGLQDAAWLDRLRGQLFKDPWMGEEAARNVIGQAVRELAGRSAEVRVRQMYHDPP